MFYYLIRYSSKLVIIKLHFITNNDTKLTLLHHSLDLFILKQNMTHKHCTNCLISQV